MSMRNLILRLLPWIAEDMERESREWMIQCPKCGREKSVWDAGGIRYRARGNPRKLGRCSQCGKLRFLRIYRATNAMSERTD